MNLRYPIAIFLLFQPPIHAAQLKAETVNAWNDYIKTVNARIRDHASRGKPFLWMDESPERAATVREGEAMVEAVGVPKVVPWGLIHHWIGTTFIPGVKLDQVLPVLRDYGRYKEFYAPGVAASRSIASKEFEDHFSMLVVNKARFRNRALQSDYKYSQFRVDERRLYTTTETTRMQEIADFGATRQHALPEGEGTGYVWRLFGLTRFDERDGGVYIETEAIALSREIPASLGWLIDPIVRRVAKASLATFLQQTRNAVLSSAPARRTGNQPSGAAELDPASRPFMKAGAVSGSKAE